MPFPTVAVLTDLWPSDSQPAAGAFVRAEVEALATHVRQVVLVPRLVAPRAHAAVWGSSVNGWQRGWSPVAPPGRLVPYPLARVPRVGERRARALGARLALTRARERPGLVHGHFLLGVAPAAVALARTLGVPAVVTAHGTDIRWLLDGGLPGRLHEEMLRACREADRLIVVERGLGERVAELGVDPARIAVLPMGVDESVFTLYDRDEARARLGLPVGVPLVVFSGRATPEKGINVLADALALLPASVRCFAAGLPGAPAARVEPLGHLGPEQLALLLAAADVACLPSFAEGMPVAVVEALACGTPVVASAVGGIPQQVRHGETGLLVEAGDAPGLAAALAEALERSEAGGWSRPEIRASSEPFWWSRLAPALATLYAEAGLR